MLILSANGMCLYDTRSGTSINIVMGNVTGVWIIQGANGENLKTCDSKEEAMADMLDLFFHSDAVRLEKKGAKEWDN